MKKLKAREIDIMNRGQSEKKRFLFLSVTNDGKMSVLKKKCFSFK